MNKSELVQALALRLDGDRRVAADAIDGLLDLIVRTVHAGESVSITGFGVFERRQRAARSARNPRTGQTIEVPATSVPAFRPGAMFRAVVSGVRPLGALAQRGTRRATGAVNGVSPSPSVGPPGGSTTQLADSVMPPPETESTEPPAKAAKDGAAKDGAAKNGKAKNRTGKDAKAKNRAKDGKDTKSKNTAKSSKPAKDGKKKSKR